MNYQDADYSAWHRFESARRACQAWVATGKDKYNVYSWYHLFLLMREVDGTL